MILLLSACANAREFKVLDAWIKPGNNGGNSAVYFIISNATDNKDTLKSIETKVASSTKIQQSSKGENGAIFTQILESVLIPAQQEVIFKPDKLDVLLIELKQDLKAGDTIEMVLNFEIAGSIIIQAPVKDHY
jgi:hypothetical protein